MNTDTNMDKRSSHSLIGAMREATWTLRAIASVVILTFGGLVTSPAVAAVKQEVQKIQWHKADSTNAAKLSAKLDEAHKLFTRFSSGDMKTAMAAADISAQRSQVHSLMSDLASLDKGAMDDFAATETHIKAHNLPAEIEKRQQDAVNTYRARMDALMTELKAADAAKDSPTFQQHVANAKAQLDNNQAKPFHEKFDPNHLPFSVAKPTAQKPRLTKKDYQAHPVVPLKRVNVASNGSLMGIVTAATLTASVPTNPSDPSYVAPTDDVQITSAIQAQAKALNNDPVQIYNWVHNNVEYIPTYGSIQGSDMTLQTLKGNDFDQASLLIALLRAANIPSRYVYGTIQVPIAQVENWVGGVTDPNAALNLLGQGGVPVTGLVQGGQIKYGQMEHVWVEAWVNFIPSRAAKPGPGNTWVPMDASFKQYTYTQGMNLQQAVPFDSAGFAQNIKNNSTIDPSGAWIQGVDQAYVQSQVQQYTTQVKTYINGANPNAGLEDVVGGKTIGSTNNHILNAGLPYAVTAIGMRDVALRDSLRWKFSYELDDANGNQVITYQNSTSLLAGSLLAISFEPATEADANAIASFVPQLDSNGVVDTTQPSSIPGYLVQVLPVISLNGQAVAVGSSSYAIGDSLSTEHGYWSPKDGWQLKANVLAAGEYHALGLDLQGISQTQVNALNAHISNVESVLQSGTLDGLTGHDLAGTMLQSAVLSYFVMNDSQDILSQRAGGVVEYRMPSFGLFKSTAKVVYLYGVPNSVGFRGATMDIEWYQTIGVSIDNKSSTLVNFYTAVGPRLSLMENVVPENLFSTPGNQVNGISATKALALASAQGQRIYSITDANIASVLPQLNVDPAVIDDIQNSVNAGKEVTISQNSLEYSGWAGVGYVVYDPSTGTGAYLLNGGANGSALEALDYVFTALGWSIGSKAALAEHYGAKDIADAMDNYFLKFLAVAGFTVSVLQVGLKCQGARASDVIIGLTAATILSLGLLSLLVFLGPIWILLIGVLLDQIVSAFTDWMEKSFCWLELRLKELLTA